MAFTEPPPIGAEFAVPSYGPDGKIIGIDLSPVWQNWFATFQEGVEVGLSLTQLKKEILTLTQDNVDSIGAAIFGADYEGQWVARTHNVGNVRSYEGKFYKCIVGRTSANTANPGNDATGWELIGSAVDLSSLGDDNINAIGGASFGGQYQGTWAAGIFAVGNVVYHSGFFYACSVARDAGDTDDPSVDTASWSVTSTTDTSGEVTQAVQAAIDAQARIEYGASYQGTWSAGTYAVGAVVYHDGVFYECDVARAPANTANPAADTASWSPKASAEGGITQAVQNAIDAQAAINFGALYRGAWKAGSFAVGDIIYYSGQFYECVTPRNSSHTQNPVADSSSWTAKTIVFSITGDVNVDLTSVTNAIQKAIDAQGTANFGDKYKDSWSAGIYAVDDVSYYDGAFYTCTVARVAANTSNPETDTNSWSVEVSESGGLSEAVQGAIDAAARINYGSAYQGTWSAGTYAVGNVVYHDGVFYECDVARAPANTANPAADTASWSPKVSIESDISAVRTEIDNARTDIGSVDTKVDQTRTDIGSVDTKVDQAISDIDGIDVSQAVQNAINAQGTAAYGDGYKGTWIAGAYAVGNVVYHSGGFYTCDVARTAANTDNPAVDTASWTIKVAVVGGLSQAVQDAIDAQAKISFGENYKGQWGAGSYAVGNVVSHSGSFYECIVGRAPTDTDDPSTDTAGWSVKESIEGGVTRAINNTIDALGAATFGNGYKGGWEAGVHAVGDVVSYNIRFYECKLARLVTDADNPSVDTNSWDLVGSAVTIRANLQDNIDALGAATYGDRYTGLWEAGSHSVDDYVSYGGRFYRCKVVRTAAHVSDPSADNTGWEAVGSSFTLQGDITTAKQENIDAAARIVFGEDYKNKWAVGTFAVGDVVYDEVTEKFYECDTARTTAHTTRPSVDTGAWSVLDALKTNVANSLGLSQLKSQIFTSSGTWPRPANVGTVKVLLIGGGAGGGGGGYGRNSFNFHGIASGGGGGGGATGELALADLSVTGNVSVTVGGGGNGGAGGQAGGSSPVGSDGGDTIFGTLKAVGGKGGGSGGNVTSSSSSNTFGTPGPGGASVRTDSLVASTGANGGNGAGTGVAIKDGSSIAGLAGVGGSHGVGGTVGYGGGGGGGALGDGGDGANETPSDSVGLAGFSAAANSGAGGGGGGGGTRGTSGTGTRNGGGGGGGGSGLAVVFWTE